MVRGSEKNVWETFVDFDICHRIAKNYIPDLDLLFEGKNLKMLLSLKW